MRTHHLLINLALFSFLSFYCSGQTISLTGTVVDANTNEPIPFVSIGSFNAPIGTSSNISGEFVLKVDSLPQELVFSHINYERRSIRILENKPIVLELTPATKILDAITVQGRKRQNYITNLVLKARQNVLSKGRAKYGKAFYRQITQTDTVYSELFEIFYDTRFNAEGIMDWEIQEGRYAIGKTILTNKNFSLLSRIWTTIQPPTDDFIMPINRDVSRLYTFSIKEVLKIGFREVAVVNFVPVEGLSKPAFEGDVYIDIDNYDILKVKGKIRDDRINFIKLTSDGYWKNYEIQYELAYKDSEEGGLAMDYISVSHNFDYYLEDEFQFPVKTNSLLSFYDYYTPLKRKRLGGRVYFKFGDATLLDRLGYDKEFWEENEIVKRTPIEKEVIDAFESRKAFGTIYLNNQKQIVLERNDLTNDSTIVQLETSFRKTTKYQEKVYLHTDKPFYASGETIWYSAYVMNASTHKKAISSQVVYVDLADAEGNVLSHQMLEITAGRAKGDILLGEKLPPGSYYLRAYTQWMRNFPSRYFYHKEFLVVGKKSDEKEKAPLEPDFDIQFFPEGGDIVRGTILRIGFKAVNENGEGINIKGNVYSGDGQDVATFKSNDLGFGSFFLNPIKNDFYVKAKYQGEEKLFKLPEVKESGYSIRVDNSKENVIQISVQASADYEETDFYIIGQTRGRISFKGKGIINEGRASVEIPKSNLPNGIFQITLFDQQGFPTCERLVFILQDRAAEVQLSSSPRNFSEREKIDLSIDLNDAEGEPLKAAFSMSVTDQVQINKDTKDRSIQSYLLLESDMLGVVENPGYYFKDNERETLRDLDHLMLTQGWRRFTWMDVYNQRVPKLKYPAEYGVSFSAIVLDEASSKPKPFTDMNFLMLTKDDVYGGYFKTDQLGRVKFSDLDFYDSAAFVFSLRNPDKKKAPIKMLSNNTPAPEAQKKMPRLNNQISDEEELAKYLEYAKERKIINEAYRQNIKVLDEVYIEGKEETPAPLSIHGEPDAVIRPVDRNYNNVFQMISGQVPGVIVSSDNQIRIRGSLNPPLIVLDGVPLFFSKMGSGAAPPPPPVTDTNGQQQTANNTSVGPITSYASQTIMNIPPSDVDRIEILKGASTSIYGIFGGDGVVAIYTRTGVVNRDHQSKKETFVLKQNGFYTAREFYAPKYQLKKPEHGRPDHRATLYWNAEVKTNSKGQAKVSFYNSDLAEKIQIDIQGVTESGEVINYLISVGETK